MDIKLKTRVILSEAKKVAIALDKIEKTQNCHAHMFDGKVVILFYDTQDFFEITRELKLKWNLHCCEDGNFKNSYSANYEEYILKAYDNQEGVAL